MSEVFRCDDKETLVAYMYGEVDQEVRREVERHLRTCAACTHETEGLQAVRQDLQLWLPPEPELTFNIVQRSSEPVAPAPVLTSSRWSSLRAVPAWAGVAAAALFIGVAASLANVQVRSTSEGFIVSTGWMQPAPLETAARSAVPVVAQNDEWRRELAALEQSLRSEIAAQRATASVPIPARANTLDVTSPSMLRRVQAMIDASVEQQRQEVAAKLMMAERTWNYRRASDLQNMNRNFASLQGRQLAVQANQQEMVRQVGHLQRVNFTQPNQ